MEMCYDGALVMPSSYAVMDEEEMTYVEGGGTITVTIKASTIKWIVATLGGAVTGYGIQVALDALGAALVTPIEFGTAGTATMAVAAFLVLWNGAAAGIAASIMGGIVGTGVAAVYKGGNIKRSFTNKALPNLKLTI